MSNTVKQVEKRLQSVSDEKDPFFVECLSDERKGVQELVKKWRRQKEKELEERVRFKKMTQFEQAARREGYNLVAGIDEVGRGPLAGPVVAAAVILPEDVFIPGLNDSKKISAKKREQLAQEIREIAIAVGIGVIDAQEIDKTNIYVAAKKAMTIAVNECSVFPDYLLIDAMEIIAPVTQKSIIKGDALSVSIASASIIAKVYRDHLMTEYSKQYPYYHFEKNMGYGTKEHLEGLDKYGPCPIHRKTFSPIKEMIKM